MHEKTETQPQAESDKPNGSGPDESDKTEFDRFENLLRRLVKVPKRDVDEKRNGG